MSEWTKKRYEAEMEVEKIWTDATIEMKTYKRDRKSPPLVLTTTKLEHME